jgi:hypothetical protein
MVLSFTSTVDKRYRAADRNYDRGGRLHIDPYCLDPEARDPLADYIFGGFAGGIGGERQQRMETTWAGPLSAMGGDPPGVGRTEFPCDREGASDAALKREFKPSGRR